MFFPLISTRMVCAHSPPPVESGSLPPSYVCVASFPLRDRRLCLPSHVNEATISPEFINYLESLLLPPLMPPGFPVALLKLVAFLRRFWFDPRPVSLSCVHFFSVTTSLLSSLRASCLLVLATIRLWRSGYQCRCLSHDGWRPGAVVGFISSSGKPF